MQVTDTLDEMSLDQFKRSAVSSITYGFFEKTAPGRYRAIGEAGSLSELLGAISAFLEAAEPKESAVQAGMSEYDYSAYRRRYDNAHQRLTPLVDSIRKYVDRDSKAQYSFCEMNEEELSDEIDRRREEILRFIATHRYERRAPGARESISRAGSLGSLSTLTKEFIEKVRPKEGEVIASPLGAADGTTAEISVFHVLVKNLTPLLEDLDEFRKGVVEIEDEREY